MDSKTLESITKKIEKKFPEITGKKPGVRRQKASENKKPSTHKGAPQNYVLTYKFNASGPSGQRIPRWIRVVATPEGKIVKITTSK